MTDRRPCESNVSVDGCTLCHRTLTQIGGGPTDEVCAAAVRDSQTALPSTEVLASRLAALRKPSSGVPNHVRVEAFIVALVVVALAGGYGLRMFQSTRTVTRTVHTQESLDQVLTREFGPVAQTLDDATVNPQLAGATCSAYKKAVVCK